MSTTIYTNSNPHVQTDFDMGDWVMPDDFYDDIDTHIYEPWTHPMYGVNHTEESKRAMSEWRTGTTLSEETKKKMSLTHTGVKKSKEHAKNIQKAFGRETISPDGIIYVSLQEASRQTGIPHTTLHRWVIGNKKGWSWYGI
tara:strand:- start:49 stop:471 length:423 start_codon:yes stop_codon:yes gene_type:complete